MAVTKRTRYEVLRRDNHTCRYCGGAAPDVRLTVDHVVPVTLGGTDDPSNLVAACSDCNSGKTSTSPDEALVAQVSDDAVRWANAMREAMHRELVAFGERETYRGRFCLAWKRWDTSLALLDPGWRGSVGRWHALGVPIELLTEAVDLAMGNSRVKSSEVFRYMAGIVWGRLKDASAQTGAALASDAPGSTPEEEEYRTGWEFGYRRGWSEGFKVGSDDAERWISDAVVHFRHLDLPCELKGVGV